MGTRGLKAVRRRGKYFITYNHSDSYPEGLGKDLVGEIPTDPNAFKSWLEGMIKQWDKTYFEYFDESGKPIRDDEDESFYTYPSAAPPENDIFIEFTYTIDLDRMAFTVDDMAHFRLDSIPRGPNGGKWIEYLTLDLKGYRCLLPRTPSEHVADICLPPDKINPLGVAAYERVKHLISTQEFDHFAYGEVDLATTLAVDTANLFILKYFSRFTAIAQSQRAQSSREFHYMSLALLLSASPLLPSLAQVFSTDDKDHWYMKGREMYQSPNPAFKWLRGVLIYFSTHLHFQEQSNAEMALLVERLQHECKSTGEPEMTGLLWSARDFFIITASKSKVQVSPRYTILDTFGKQGGDKTRFKNLGILARVLAPKFRVSNIPGFSACLPLDVFERILLHVDNEWTYWSCASLCKTLYIHITSRPRIGKYTLLSVVQDHSLPNKYNAYCKEDPLQAVVQVRCSQDETTGLMGTGEWKFWRPSSSGMLMTQSLKVNQDEGFETGCED